MNKFSFLLAASAVAMISSCSTDEFNGQLGPDGVNAGNMAISFGSTLNNTTRAGENYITGDEGARKLGYAFNVFGFKNTSTTDLTATVPFNNWTVRYNKSNAGYDTYTNGWYYNGATNAHSADNQTTRFWDLSARAYYFVAATPSSVKFFGADGASDPVLGQNIIGKVVNPNTLVGGRLHHEEDYSSRQGLSVPDSILVTAAKPVKRVIRSAVSSEVDANNNPNVASDATSDVKLYFDTQQARVRVGIYSTISGYNISDIKFYHEAPVTPAPAEAQTSTNYATLYTSTSNYFRGGKVGETPVITYAWNGEQQNYDNPTVSWNLSGARTSTYFEAGNFAQGVKATTSSDAANLYGTGDAKDPDMNEKGWFVVLPTKEGIEASDLTLRCDYTLKSTDDAADVIKVIGATAIIPKDYTKWAINKSYTYIFQISKNSNGTTGPEDPNNPGTPTNPNDPTGLYPIRFDAFVQDDNIGTESSMTPITITVTQAKGNNVNADGITFVPATGEDSKITVHTSESATVSYRQVDGDFDYEKTFEAQKFVDQSSWTNIYTSATSGDLNTLAAGTYVLKATTETKTSYFVLVVKAPASSARVR